MLARLLALLVLAGVVYVPAAQTASATQPAASTASLAAPAGVHGFLLRADEPVVSTFERTPSFAWEAYDGAASYDFQLATSSTFDERAIAWSTDSRSTPLKVPAVTIPIALPWMTGHPHALYVRVRAQTTAGVTRWSAPFGFNTQWKTTPEPLRPDAPGLIRWTPVDGATCYQVWFDNLQSATQPSATPTTTTTTSTTTTSTTTPSTTTPSTTTQSSTTEPCTTEASATGTTDGLFFTTTNVADEREYYDGQHDPTLVAWRVRAIRKLYGALPNLLPAVSFGPWSERFVSVNAPTASGPLSLVETISDTVGGPATPATHTLTPGYAYSGQTGMSDRYRVYVSTDRGCVNIVYTGSAVRSPAWAPRASNGGDSGPAIARDGITRTPNEAVLVSTAARTSSATASGTPGSGSAIPADFTTPGPSVDLWDLGRPNARYWWTVVPVGSDGVDAELAQDACVAGRVGEFAKTTRPVLTSPTRPYVSGLSAFGDLVAARTAKSLFYGAPLVAWQPAASAIGYEVQWSRTRSPWRPADGSPFYTAATSALLDNLTPGTWYYRVRGIDPYIPGPIKQMTWSAPVAIKIAMPRFLVESSVTVRPVKK